MLLKTHYGEKAKLEILNAYRTIAASDEDNIKSINFDYQVLPNVWNRLVITSAPTQDSFILATLIDLT